MTSKLAISRTQAMIDNHRRTTGLEGDDETILWHIIRDTLEWCDSRAVNFDLTVETVREDYRSGD